MIGIDIGNNTCKIAVKEGNGYRFISQRMPENLMRDGDVSSPETMAKFLTQVKREEKIKGSDCSLVLNPAQAYFRHVTMPPLSIDELELNLPYEFRDFVSDDPETYVYDYSVDEIVYDEEGKPIRMELFAAAASKADIDTYSTMLKKAGFKLKVAIPAPLAYSRLLQEHAKVVPEDAEKDMVMVDIGHEDLILSLFRGSNYDASRTVDFGCDEFDRIIADIKEIDPYTAGSFKFTNFEGVLDEPECLALCDRFAVEVAKVVNFYNFSNPDRDIEQICFLGGGANIPQLTRAIAEAVSVPAYDISAILPAGAAGQPNAASCALALAALLESEVS